MRQEFYQRPRTLPIEDSSPTNVPIPPQYSTLVHFGWMVFTVLSVILFIFGLPERFSELLIVPADVQLALDQSGVTNLGWAVGLLAPEIVLMLVYTAIGISLYIQKSRSLKILIVSLVLISWGTTILNVVEALAIKFPALDIWILFTRAFSWSLVMTLLLVFPNGRLYPSWAKWLLAFWYVWIWSWFFFPELPHNISVHGGLADPFRFIAYFLLLGLGLVIQIRRYQKISTPSERQQTKWAFLGIGLMFVITFIEEAPSALNPALINQNTPESILYTLVSTTIFVIGSLAFPLGVAFSIQQKRLWQIDYVINRSLVFAVMTAFLALAFFILYQLMTSLLLAITGSHSLPLVTITSTLIALSLFRPARRTLQRWIDRCFYHIHIDYQQQPKHEPSHGFSLLEEYNQVGDYEIVELVARGGMAEIFKGRHVTSGQEAAIKVLLEPYAHQEAAQQRFAHEAKTISTLEHSNIIKLFDYGETGDLFYIIMEFVSYHTLATQIKTNAPFDLDFTRHIIWQTAQALDYSHQNGIIHRDIKPSNLLLRPPAAGQSFPQPVLSDFGIAKTNQHKIWHHTRSFAGSFDYISPEQIRASDAVDHRTDIYSLGVIAFQLLSGRLPFQAGTRAEVLIAHLRQPAPNILAYNPELPDKVAFAILKAMAKNPEDRFDQAGLFAQALLQD